MQHFIDWLYATPLSLFIQTRSWIIPTIQIIHILTLSVLFTSMMMMDFRLMGIAGTQHSVEYYSNRFLPWLWRSLPIMLITGLVLIIAEPGRDLKNLAFYLKMTMLIIASLLMYGLQRSVKRDPALWEDSHGHRRLGQVMGLVSVLLWICIIISGRLIAYV